jgi:translocation and assembly module TamB
MEPTGKSNPPGTTAAGQAPAESRAASVPGPSKPQGLRRALVRVLRGLALIILAALAAWQFGPVRTWAVNRVLAATNPYPKGKLTAERVNGSLIRSLSVMGLQLRNEDQSTPLRLDSLALRYHILPAILGKIRVDEIAIRGLRVTATRDSSGAIDLLAPFLGPKDTASVDLVLGLLSVDSTSFSIQDTSGLWSMENIALRLADLETLPHFSARVDSLSGRVSDPVSRVPGHVMMTGQISDLSTRIDTFLFQTSRSFVSAAGSLAGAADSTEFTLSVNPLHFDDIRGLVPSLKAGGSATLIGHGSTRGSNVSLTLAGRVGGGELDAVVDVILPGPGSSAAVAGSFSTHLLDLSRVLENPPQIQPVSLQSEANLSGKDWQSLSGTAQIVSALISTQQVQISGLSLEQEWREGLVAFHADALVNESAAVLDGTIDPRAEGMPATIEGALSAWPLSEWTGGAVQGSVTMDITGGGLLGEGRWQADSKLRDSTLGACAIDGEFHISSENPSLGGVLDLQACDGRLTGSGSFDTSARSWRLNHLTASDFPFARAAGDTTRSQLNGRLSGHGSGNEFSAVVNLGPTAYGSYRADSAKATVSGQTDRWQGVGDAHSGAGSATFDLDGFSSSVRVNLLDLRSLDASYAAGVTALSTSISAQVTGLVRSGQTDLEVDVLPSRVNDQRFTSGYAQLRMRSDTVNTSGSVQMEAGGDLAWSANIDLANNLASVDGLSFDKVNLGAFLLNLPVTELSGNMEGRLGRGRLDGRLTLAEEGHINQISVGGGVATFAGDPDSLWTDAHLRLGAGSAALKIGVDRVRESYWGLLSLSGIDALGLAGIDSAGSSMTSQLRLTGRGFDPKSGVLAAVVDSLRLTYGTIRVDSSRGGFSWGAGVLRVDSLELRGRPLRARIHGEIPLTDDAENRRFAIRGAIEADNVGPVAAMIGQELATSSVVLNISGAGRPGSFQASAEATLRGVRYGEVNVANSNFTGSVELAGLVVRAAELRAAATVVSLPGIAAESGNLLMTLADDSLRFEADFTVEPGRWLTAVGGATSDLRIVRVESLEMTLDDSEWHLLAPADFRLESGVEIFGLVAAADSQRIALGGYASTPEGDDLYLSASGVRVDAIADILGYTGLGAALNATLNLRSNGPGQARSLAGTLSGTIRNKGDEVGVVEARVSLQDTRLNIDGAMEHVSGASAQVRGFLPFSLSDADLSAEPVNVGIVADSLPIDWTLPFFDPAVMDDLGGLISADASIRGTYGEPRLTGGADLTNGLMSLPFLGRQRKSLVYDRASVYLDFSGDGVKVDSASVRSGSGRATASGSIAFADLTLGQIDLDVLARDFLAIDSEPYRAVVGGNLKLQGTNRSPRLGGQVRVEQGDFFLTEETTAEAFEPVTFTEQDLLTLEERFGIRVSESDTTTFDFYEAMEIADLRIDLARNTWLRSTSNPVMEIQFTGDLDVEKSPHADPEVFGSIQVLPGRSRIDQFGRRFQIEEGTLTFSGPIAAPDMNLGAAYEVRARNAQGSEVTISLRALGSPENLQVSFESDPQMELADIVSYIATGRPASESLQFGGSSSDGYLRSAAGLAVGPITSLVENLASAGLGLDVVEIDQDETNGLMLTAGKYVSPRFFVSVSQPLSLSLSTGTTVSDATVVTMEYEVVRNVLVSLLTRGTVLRVNLSWERAY